MGRCASKNLPAELGRPAQLPISETSPRRMLSSASPKANGTLVIDNHAHIEQHYHLDASKRRIRPHGCVYKSRHVLSGEVRAVKTIRKVQADDLSYFKQECITLKQLDHPNIVKLYETFDDEETQHLVLEFCYGGPILERIFEAGHFSEADATMGIQQVLHAVNYMHVSHSLCHRDLTLDHVFLVTKAPIDQSIVKLIDFGFAKRFDKTQMMTTRVTFLHYMSPQVLAGRYNESCDIWSVGVMTYVLLCGYPPFSGETELEVSAKIKEGCVPLDGPAWAGVSEDAKDFIRMLLKMDPQNRYTAEQGLNHPWIESKVPKASNFALHAGFIDHLRSFGATNDFKKTVLHIIAGQLTEDRIKELGEIFKAFDINGDGLITIEEMTKGVRQAGVKDVPADFVDIVNSIDSHESGGIDYTEFLAASLEKRQYLKEGVCFKAFSVFDRDGDGCISREEMAQVLNSGSLRSEVGAQAIDRLMKEFDNNGDGKIDFEEFMLMMLRNCSPRRASRQQLLWHLESEDLTAF